MGGSIVSRIAGVLILVVTIGLASCQALFVGPPDTPADEIADQTGEG